jgi:DNA-binding response OmpR family regulator
MAKKLLVVDSNLAIQKLVEYNLSREKFEVTCLNDGLSALDLLPKLDPDLILADYHLEGISFSRFCEKVKQKQTEKERPILVLVSPADAYDPKKLLSLGVVDFVKKPLEPKELIEKLKDLSQEAATMVDSAPRPPTEPPPPEPKTEPAEVLPRPSLKEQAEIMKIEELLGWSVAGIKPAEEEMPNSAPDGPAIDNEMTVVENRATSAAPLRAGETEPVEDPSEVSPSPPMEAPAAPSMEDAEQTMIESGAPLPSSPPPPETEAPPPATPPTDTPSQPISPAELEAQFPQLYAAPESVEPPPAAQPAPDLAPSAPSAAVSEAAVQEAVSKIAKEIIEKVAWDVVPSLAEHLIKEELEKLKTEKPS